MTSQHEQDDTDSTEEEWVPPPRKPPPPVTIDRWRIRFSDGREIGLRFRHRDEIEAAKLAKDPNFKPKRDAFSDGSLWDVDDGNDYDSLEEWEETPEGWLSAMSWWPTMESAALHFFMDLVEYHDAVALLRPYEQVTIAVRAARAVSTPPADAQPVLPGVDR